MDLFILRNIASDLRFKDAQCLNALGLTLVKPKMFNAWFGGYSLRHQIVMAAREAIRNPGVAAGGGVIRGTLVFACHYYVYHGSNMLADVY